MRAKPGGQPLRFFGLAMLGWIVFRFGGIDAPFFTQPPLILAEPAPSPNTTIPFAAAAIWAPMPAGRPTTHIIQKLPPHRPQKASPLATKVGDGAAAVNLLDFVSAAASFTDGHHPTTPDWSDPAPPTATPAPLASRQQTDRWRAATWLLWRAGSGAGPGPGPGPIAAGRLGGSQAGLRVDYALTPDAHTRTAAYARFSSALNQPASPEGAIGIAIQPIRHIPVTIAAERRIALGEGGRNANSLMIVGGFGPARVVTGIEAEGYAQAGMVGFHNRDGFVDGKLSVLTPLPHLPIRTGASVSGGAQPGAGRLDIGPEIQVHLPRLPARLSIEWRHRIAGHARPQSGLAITLAADF